MPTPRISTGVKRLLVPLVTLPVSLILSQSPAEAVLNINIYNNGPNLEVLVTGSLSTLGNYRNQNFWCGGGSVLYELPRSVICSGGAKGIGEFIPSYSISGPLGFGSTASLGIGYTDLDEYLSGISISGLAFVLSADDAAYGVSSFYIPGQPFLSSATFNNTSLESQGFTTLGPAGTWTIDGTSESINLFIGPPAGVEVPGPLPLLGVGAAFGWSRSLRRRMNDSVK